MDGEWRGDPDATGKILTSKRKQTQRKKNIKSKPDRKINGCNEKKDYISQLEYTKKIFFISIDSKVTARPFLFLKIRLYFNDFFL